MSSDSREISPFHFFEEDEDGDFRPIDREVPDPKDESAQESAPSSDLTVIPESEAPVTVSTETSQPKVSETSTATSSQSTRNGRSEQPAPELPPLPPTILIPGSQSEGKQISPTKQS